MTRGNTKPTSTIIPPAIKSAAAKVCRKRRISMSRAVCEGLLLLIDRPDLAEHLPKMGRPPNEETQR